MARVLETVGRGRPPLEAQGRGIALTESPSDLTYVLPALSRTDFAELRTAILAGEVPAGAILEYARRRILRETEDPAGAGFTDFLSGP